MFYADSRVKLGQETRLCMTSKEVETAGKSLGEDWSPFMPLSPFLLLAALSLILLATSASLHCFSLSRNAFCSFCPLPADQWTPPKFSTECFFLTAHSHHLSTSVLIRRQGQLQRELKHCSDVLKSMDKSDPVFDKVQTRCQYLAQYKQSLDTILLDSELLQRTLVFYGSLAEWITYIQTECVHLPISSVPSIVWFCFVCLWILSPFYLWQV